MPDSGPLPFARFGAERGKLGFRFARSAVHLAEIGIGIVEAGIAFQRREHPNAGAEHQQAHYRFGVNRIIVLGDAHIGVPGRGGGA